MTRRLTLARERLADLTPDDLATVAGAAQTNGGLCDKLTIATLTGYYPSINAPCTTD